MDVPCRSVNPSTLSQLHARRSMRATDTYTCGKQSRPYHANTREHKTDHGSRRLPACTRPGGEAWRVNPGSIVRRGARRKILGHLDLRRPEGKGGRVALGMGSCMLGTQIDRHGADRGGAAQIVVVMA